MKHEAVFFSRGGTIYDAQKRRRFFRGMVVDIPQTKHDIRIEQNIPLEDADAHFSRLRTLGCTLLIWNLAWESVEPTADEYDEEYLAQLRLVLKKAEEYNLFVIVRPVMEGWSRWTGGVGAPRWTLDAAGIDVEKLAICSRAFSDYTKENALDMAQVNPFQEYARSTMFSLFWNGRTFAPELVVDGDNIQDYLQSHYIAAMKHTARRIKDCNAVIGFSFMGGAHHGFIGTRNISETYPADTAVRPGTLEHDVSPFNMVQVANGGSIEYKKPGGKFAKLRPPATVTFSCDGGIFKDGSICPWEQACVWHKDNTGKAILDKPDFFNMENLDFTEQLLKPFQREFVAAFQKKHDHYVFLAEPTTAGQHVRWKHDGTSCKEQSVAAEKEGGVLSEHDAEAAKIIAMFTVPHLAKTRGSSFDVEEFEKSLQAEIRSQESMIPAVGFCNVAGIDATAKETGSQGALQTEQFSLVYNFLDKHFASCLLNCYRLGTTRSDSIYDDERRAVRLEKGFCRPYVCALNGTPVNMLFTRKPAPAFELEWDALPQETGTDTNFSTEIFIPSAWFPNGWKVEQFDGVGTLTCQPEKQRLFVTTLTQRRCYIKVVGNL